LDIPQKTPVTEVILTKTGKLRIVLECLMLMISIALPVYAYTYFTQQQMSTGIIILTPTVQIRVYSDPAATKLVTIIDFGKIYQPNVATSLQKVLYIKNEGTVETPIYWKSTLKSVTNKITDGWFTNGTTITPTMVLWTAYNISIPALMTVGTYNWTLTVWGEY